MTSHQGFAVWLSGLSGAGKSTISEGLAAEFARRKIPLAVLDGDEVRTHLSQGLGYTRQDRDTNIARMAYVAALLVRNGIAVVTAAISPYAKARDEARACIGNFLEVYVRCSIEELIRRDVKGLYAKALRGELENFTGISDDYEEPHSPDLIVNTEEESVGESINKIVTALESRGWLVFSRSSP
jgi:adenylylsulfate kinase